jgi:predicted acyl esterase
MLIVEYILSSPDTRLHKERGVRRDVDVEIPGYLGGCRAMHNLHLPGDFQSYEDWKGLKKLTLGPPPYLDRPVHQYADEWKQAYEWPLSETKWIESCLHTDGLLSERETWPDEISTVFVGSQERHGSQTFLAPITAENTEVCDPIALNLFASTTDTEVLWFADYLEIDKAGNERVLTSGRLRGPQRPLYPQGTFICGGVMG